MNYISGEKINVGDRVESWSGTNGVVVASLDDGIFSSGFPFQDWLFLKAGVLVEMDNGEVMHFSVPDFDLRFIKS